MKIGFANLDFATAQRKDQNVVQWFLERRCEMLGFVEAKRNNVREMLPPGWRVEQSMRNESLQGTAIAWQSGVADVTRRRWRIAVRHGRAAMLDRWARTIDAEDEDGAIIRVVVAHNAPGRYKYLWPAWYANIRWLIRRSPQPGRWVVLSDFNEPHQSAARKLKGHSVGNGIIGAVAGDRVTFDHFRSYSAPAARGWIDHPCFTVNVEPISETRTHDTPTH